MSEKKRLGLRDAYAVETPEDNLRLYHDWAETYDGEFATTQGYSYPRTLAELFADRANEVDSPVLVVGAGTGLVAQSQRCAGPVHGEFVIQAASGSSNRPRQCFSHR